MQRNLFVFSSAVATLTFALSWPAPARAQANLTPKDGCSVDTDCNIDGTTCGTSTCTNDGKCVPADESNHQGLSTCQVASDCKCASSPCSADNSEAGLASRGGQFMSGYCIHVTNGGVAESVGESGCRMSPGSGSKSPWGWSVFALGAWFLGSSRRHRRHESAAHVGGHLT